MTAESSVNYEISTSTPHINFSVLSGEKGVP